MAQRRTGPNLAGASAEREYRRRLAARENRMRDRLGRRLGRIFLAVTEEPRSTQAWALGAQGEREVALALEGVPGVHLLNDLHVHGSRRNIDHVAVGPAGVFVIDAKNYRGRIGVRDIGGLFQTDQRLFVGRRDCSGLADDMKWQVAAVAGTISSAGLAAVPLVTPVLCFAEGDWPLFRPPSEFRGVRLEGTNSIKKLVTRGQSLDPRTIELIANHLAGALRPSGRHRKFVDWGT